MDIEGENMEQDGEPVEKAVEKRGKSQELASAGRKKPTARDVINSHRFVRYWMPTMWQTHKTLIRLLVLIYELSTYEINSR